MTEKGTLGIAQVLLPSDSVRWPTSLRHLTFQVAFNKTLRESKAGVASQAGQVSQQVPAKRVRAWEPVQADLSV